MKRIIYSIYTSTVDPHKSSTDYKKAQFEKYKHCLEKTHKDYAYMCNADYDLEITPETDYDKIQFDKIKKLQYLIKYYDEVLYLDFDVVPTTNKNIFDYFVKKVSREFLITEEDLMTKSKRRDIVDARHLLYYLCFHRPMQIRYIQEYMGGYGYNVGHSTIIHGIDVVSDKVESDEDYQKIVKELSQTLGS